MDKKIGIGIGSSKWFFGDNFFVVFQPKMGELLKSFVFIKYKFDQFF